MTTTKEIAKALKEIKSLRKADFHGGKSLIEQYKNNIRILEEDKLNFELSQTELIELCLYKTLVNNNLVCSQVSLDRLIENI